MGGKQQARVLASKGDQRDVVATHVAIGEHLLDRALRFGEPLERGAEPEASTAKMTVVSVGLR